MGIVSEPRHAAGISTGVKMSGGRPKLSVIVRTFNAWPVLEKVLERLGCHPDCEIILVDSGSVDLPGQLPSNVTELVHYRQKPFSYGGSLNAGLAAARGEWIWVLSSHCVPVHEDVVRRVLRFVVQLPIGVACVLGKIHQLGTKAMQEADRNLSWRTVVGRSYPGGNPNCLYRAAMLKAFKFDEAIEICEDVEIYIRFQRAGLVVAQSDIFGVEYRSRRPVSVFFSKGYHQSRVSRMLGKPRENIGWRIGWFAIKGLGKALTGRLTWGEMIRKEALRLGCFVGELSYAWTMMRAGTTAARQSGEVAPALPTRASGSQIEQ